MKSRKKKQQGVLLQSKFEYVSKGNSEHSSLNAHLGSLRSKPFLIVWWRVRTSCTSSKHLCRGLNKWSHHSSKTRTRKKMHVVWTIRIMMNYSTNYSMNYHSLLAHCANLQHLRLEVKDRNTSEASGDKSSALNTSVASASLEWVCLKGILKSKISR